MKQDPLRRVTFWLLSGMKSLWGLLSVLSFTTPLFCALTDGVKIGGIVAILISLVVGSGIGFGNVFGLKAVGSYVTKRLPPNADKRWERILMFLYVGSGIWIFVSSFLAMGITRFFIHRLAT